MPAARQAHRPVPGPNLIGDRRRAVAVAGPSRSTFLRYRLAITGVGLGLFVVGALPWLVLVAAMLNASGALQGFLVVLGLAMGVLFLPFLWLGLKAARLAWRPLTVWEPMQQAWAWQRRRGGQGTRRQGPDEDVIDAQWRERP